MGRMETNDTIAPDLADIETLARTAIEALPDAFRSPAREIALRVVDLADDDMLKSLDMDDPFALTGLYDGVPMTEKSVSDQPGQPDAIWLFRRAILDEWVARGDVGLAELVTHVTIHELAHHFGWSDEDIASIDEWWR